MVYVFYLQQKAAIQTQTQKDRADAVAGLSFVAPAAIILFVFLTLPLLVAFYFSFTNWPGTRPLDHSEAYQVVGLRNYDRWLMLMFYFWPIYCAMQRPTTIGVLRNALVLVLRHSAFTLIHALGLVALGALCLILPFLAALLTFAFAAILSTHAVMHCLAQAGNSRQAV